MTVLLRKHVHDIVDLQMIGCSGSLIHVFVVSLFDMMSPLNAEFMCLFLTLFFRTGIGTKAGANLSMFICPPCSSDDPLAIESHYLFKNVIIS